LTAAVLDRTSRDTLTIPLGITEATWGFRERNTVNPVPVRWADRTLARLRSWRRNGWHHALL